MSSGSTIMEKKDMSYESIFGTGQSKLLDLSDGKLRTEDGYTFKVHKYVLAKSSNYFYALFCGMEKDKNEISILGIRGEILGKVLCYIYTGNIYLNQENVTDLLLVSDYLLLDDLLHRIKIYARNNISISNCIAVLAASLRINQEDVMLSSFRFIQTHFEFLVNYDSSKIEELPYEVFNKLLSDENLCVMDENTIWRAIIRWVNANEISRKVYVSCLLLCLKTADMDETLATAILGHNTVAMNEFCNEVNGAKHVNDFSSDLDVLNYFIETKYEPGVEISNSRHPSKLYFIGYYSVLDGLDGIQIYVTYDENIDLWRKIAEAAISPEFMVSIGQYIFMFSSHENRCLVYNFIENQWVEIVSTILMRYNFFIVKHDECIYKLGGISVVSGNEIFAVEVYSPLLNMWTEIAPMIPVASFVAESMDRKIYVIGQRPGLLDFDMIAQEYDPDFNTWSALPSPTIFRYSFTLVAYRHKLYVIGGFDETTHLKKVEEYDPQRKLWKVLEDLPYLYYFPSAIILNDQLVVYDGHLEDRCYLRSYPPVRWNSDLHAWEPFPESSSLNELHIYYFSTSEDPNSLGIITKKNREMITDFEKSPFC